MKQTVIDYLDARYGLDEIVRCIYNPPDDETAVAFVVSDKDADAYKEVFGQRITDQLLFGLDVVIDSELDELDFRIDYDEQAPLTVHDKPDEESNLKDKLLRLRNILDEYINDSE